MLDGRLGRSWQKAIADAGFRDPVRRLSRVALKLACATGQAFPQSHDALRLAQPDELEDASNELPSLARMALQRAQLQWLEVECHIAWCDERIAAHVRNDAQAKAATQLSGMGPVTASALVASVGDFTPFKSGQARWPGRLRLRRDTGPEQRPIH